MIVEKELFMTKLNETRKIFIYLPDDYDTSNKQYPVLYAFDGHNIFLDAHATYGKAIHIQQHIEKLGIDMIVAPRKIGFIFIMSQVETSQYYNLIKIKFLPFYGVFSIFFYIFHLLSVSQELDPKFLN